MGNSRGDVVAGWLEGAGLGQYAPAFARLDERAFCGLLMQDYAKYGVTALEHKQKVSGGTSGGRSGVSEPDRPRPRPSPFPGRSAPPRRWRFEGAREGGTTDGTTGTNREGRAGRDEEEEGGLGRASAPALLSALQSASFRLCRSSASQAGARAWAAGGHRRAGAGAGAGTHWRGRGRGRGGRRGGGRRRRRCGARCGPPFLFGVFCLAELGVLFASAAHITASHLAPGRIGALRIGVLETRAGKVFNQLPIAPRTRLGPSPAPLRAPLLPITASHLAPGRIGARGPRGREEGRGGGFYETSRGLGAAQGTRGAPILGKTASSPAHVPGTSLPAALRTSSRGWEP